MTVTTAQSPDPKAPAIEASEGFEAIISLPLAAAQVEHLRRLTSPNASDPDLIAGPDWAVMIGLEASDAFWASGRAGGPVTLPFGDSSAAVSARGRDGLRHTRVRLQDNALQVTSNSNSPIKAGELAAVLASCAGTDDVVDLSDAWRERDLAQNTATAYNWPTELRPEDRDAFETALRRADERLGDAVTRLRDRTVDLTAEQVNRIEAETVSGLADVRGQAESNFDEGLENFVTLAAHHVRGLAASRRTHLADEERREAFNAALAKEQAREPAASRPSPEADRAPEATTQDHPRREDQAEQTATSTRPSTAPDPAQVAKMLLERHMSDVEDELELFRARLAGTHRVLDEAPRPGLQQDYQRWEIGLQRLEAAYRVAARCAERLSGSAEWQKIAEVWESLQKLVKHFRDDVVHLGTLVIQRWEPHLQHAAVAAGGAVADLSRQLGARLDQLAEGIDGREGNRFPVRVAVQDLEAAGHDFAADAAGPASVETPQPHKRYPERRLNTLALAALARQGLEPTGTVTAPRPDPPASAPRPQPVRSR